MAQYWGQPGAGGAGLGPAGSLWRSFTIRFRWRGFGASWSQVAQLCGGWIGAGLCREANQALPEHADLKPFTYMDMVEDMRPCQ